MQRLAVILLFIMIGSCRPELPWTKNQNLGAALGTTYAITYLTEEKEDFQHEIDSVFKVVNKSMSTYIPESDISKINAGDNTIVVDEMFKEVYEISNKVYSATNGYFDPTVGVLVNAWGFGPGRQIELDSVKIDSLLNFVGFDKVKLIENGTIQKQNPEIRFDFNAVAKGYAIDRLAAMLEDNDVDNYLVEVGGEIYAAGMNKISNKRWVVGIDNPGNLVNRGSAATIHLTDKALASSGNYRKYRIDSLTGEKYVHTIDPKTGYTKNSKILAASVIADDCATADAFATAFMAMDLEKAKEYLENQNEIEAFIIFSNSEGNDDFYMTSGFEERVLANFF